MAKKKKATALDPTAYVFNEATESFEQHTIDDWLVFSGGLSCAVTDLANLSNLQEHLIYNLHQGLRFFNSYLRQCFWFEAFCYDLEQRLAANHALKTVDFGGIIAPTWHEWGIKFCGNVADGVFRAADKDVWLSFQVESARRGAEWPFPEYDLIRNNWPAVLKFRNELVARKIEPWQGGHVYTGLRREEIIFTGGWSHRSEEPLAVATADKPPKPETDTNRRGPGRPATQPDFYEKIASETLVKGRADEVVKAELAPEMPAKSWRSAKSRGKKVLREKGLLK